MNKRKKAVVYITIVIKANRGRVWISALSVKYIQIIFLRVFHHVSYFEIYTVASLRRPKKFDFLHEFDWENIDIFDEGECLQKWLTSEMIYIKKQTNGLNIENDTDSLDAIYCITTYLQRRDVSLSLLTLSALYIA
ncbi:hypothetical protein ALC56_14779 [Trachymyrmex septentrionalis]|uniref:Uncharacterized protein n=1 Tax=Trachymyrmex septentrionalis TaxID=34720 RepID=A0A195ESS6_9HYME|nr:hypothetical protein ALC56_14779 [Trachymyrmex septentrionalis]